MDKRAQGLPITTVILAILGIVVLVILFAIMTGRLTIFAGAANECPGVCVVNNAAFNDYNLGSPTPGVLEEDSLPLRGSGCKANLEKKLFGNFIASGIRGGAEGKDPVPCKACCQPIA